MKENHEKFNPTTMVWNKNDQSETMDRKSGQTDGGTEKKAEEKERTELDHIEEAAATLSKEGLQSLANFLAQNVEERMQEKLDQIVPALAEKLAPVIREMVRKEMSQLLSTMLQGLRSGKREFVQSRVTANHLTQPLTNSFEKQDFAITPVRLESQPLERRRSTSEFTEFVSGLLRERGHMKLKDIFMEAERQGFANVKTNKTLYMQKAMSENPQIEKKGHGVYGWRET